MEVNATGEVILGGTYFPPASAVAEAGLLVSRSPHGRDVALLRKGDVVDVAPGDLRTVVSVGAGIRAAGGGDGKGRA